MPANTIGYFGVIVPAIDEFQGFFLVDDPSFHKEAVKMQMMALATQPKGVIGALQATIVEGFVTGNQRLVAIGALALHGVCKNKFFIIKGDRQPGGTVTEMIEMKATTVDEARSELDKHPLVVGIKNHLVDRYKDEKRH